MALTKKIIPLSFTLLLLTVASASAASFVVSPIKVFFNKELSKDKITITNNGIEDVSLQVTVKEWKQDKSGTDSYHPTKEIIFFPKLFSLKKGEKRVVRLGFKGKFYSKKEMTYRIFVDQIRNNEVPKDGKLHLLLKIGVPIFITPDKVKEEVVIEEPVIKKDNISILLTNRGNTHIIVKKIYLEGLNSTSTLFKKEKRGWYTLSGKTTRYTVGLTKEECSALTTLSIKVSTPEQDFTKEVQVDSAACSS